MWPKMNLRMSLWEACVSFHKVNVIMVRMQPNLRLKKLVTIVRFIDTIVNY